MSTSTLPSRTRSLRKPSDASHNNTGTGRYGRPVVSSSSVESNNKDASNPTQHPAAPLRSSQSPSRLPMKPATRSANTLTRPPSSTESNVSNTSMRPPPSRTTVTKPSSGGASGLQRSTSTRRPSDASQTSNGSSLQRSIPTRRPSASSKSTTTTGDPSKQDRSRPPLTQYKHLRNASTSSVTSQPVHNSSIPSHGHSRTKSTSSTLLTGTTTLRPPSRDTSHHITQNAAPSTKDISQLPNPTHRKATFSTYNQHFSPAKSLAPKPPSSSFLIPPSPSKLPSNIAISAETAKLQNELLQLHLLHKDSTRVRQEWEQSARSNLELRFDQVVARNADLQSQERREMSTINATAFALWTEVGVPGLDLPTKVRMLDDILTGVWTLIDASGSSRYARVVRTFEKYLYRTQEILNRREDAHDALDEEEVEFILPLPKEVKHEILHLERKIQDWHRDLEALGDPDDKYNDNDGHDITSSEASHNVKSTLSRVLNKLNDTVQGMIEELATMKNLEDEIVRREEDWIRKMIHDDDNIDDNEGTEEVVAGAIWRRI